jgi:heme A synthase
MRRLFKISAVAVGVIYAQLIVGAVMRHYEAGLAMPLGQLLPPISAKGLATINGWRMFKMNLPAVTMSQIWVHFGHRVGAVLVTTAIITVATLAVRQRRRTRWEPIFGAFLAAIAGLIGLGTAYVVASTFGWLAGLAVLSTAVVAFFILRAFLRRLGEARPVLAPAVLLSALLLTQVTLGVLTVWLRKPADIASAHVAVGALTLVTTFILAARAWRISDVAATLRKAADSVGDLSSSTHGDYKTQREPVLAA